LTLDEIAAAAEMILAQEEDSDASSDEELSEAGDLGDSGYGGGESPMDSRYVTFDLDHELYISL